MHPLVSDYLDRLAELLGDVPFRTARELLDQIEAHLADALPSGPSDEQVRAALEQLGTPEEIAAEADGRREGVSARAGPLLTRRGRHVRSAVIVGACAMVVATGLLVGLTGGLFPGPPPKPGATTASRPTLLSYLPKPTPAVLLASGQAGREHWRFWVSMGPLRLHTIRVPGGAPAMADGLTTIVQFFRMGRFVEGSGGPGGDPRHMPQFEWSGFGGSGINGDYVLGVTSQDVATVRVDFEGSSPSVTVRTLGTPALPGLRFFIALVPNLGVRSVVWTTGGDRVLYTSQVPQPTQPSAY